VPKSLSDDQATVQLAVDREYVVLAEAMVAHGEADGSATLRTCIREGVFILMMIQTIQMGRDQDGDSKTQVRASTNSSRYMALKKVTSDEAP
jgi:hypothetical protein